ncbi:lipopolysaccharide biosynthesis protein [Rubripirellula amarantea]|nr:hypothetical protein [Rubripirellula amarantea]
MTDLPSERRSWPRRLLNRMEVDRAVFYAIASRGWQFLAGPITILMIASYFTKEVQGYFYTFGGVVALQMFFELGFPQVIINFASHEWGKLALADDGSIEGDADALSRLSSLFRASMICFAAVTVVLALTILVVGWIMFSRDEHSDAVNWKAPWIALSILSAIGFSLSPTLIVLEGCDQVRNVYKMQFVRAVLGNLAVWVAIPLGAALWTPVIATVVRLVCECYFIFVPYRKFFRAVSSRPTGPVLNWRRDIWPFQWRIGFRGLFSYFSASLMSPIVFVYQDAVAAGQFGLVWQVLNAIYGACGAWVRTRMSKMGTLVAKREFQELDRMFYRVSTIGLSVMVATCITFVVFDWALYYFNSPYATRMLTPLPTICLAFGMTAAMAMEYQGLYMHAHQRSPFLVTGIACATASGLLIWWWGAWFGVLGVAVAFFTMNMLINLPLWTYLWHRFRREYYHQLGSSEI